jgi:hypothetical protein
MAHFEVKKHDRGPENTCFFAVISKKANGDSFAGTTQTSVGPEVGGMTVKTVIEGKRVGKCD